MSLLPKGLKEKADPQRYAINGFIIDAAAGLPDGAVVLDAGAGNLRYKKFFSRHNYIAADFCKAADQNYKKMDFITDLNLLSLKDDSVDAVINIQVLEHVPDPAALVTELCRVLKPGGSLFLSCPQGAGVHMPPYDYYRFTSFALELIFEKAGMDVVYIRPIGGYFNHIAKQISRLPLQFDERAETPIKDFLFRLRHAVLKEVFKFWVPYLVSRLDFLDKKQNFTIGYLCHTKKPSDFRQPAGRG